MEASLSWPISLLSSGTSAAGSSAATARAPASSTTAGRQGISLGHAMALSGHRGVTVGPELNHQAGAALNNPAAGLAD